MKQMLITGGDPHLSQDPPGRVGPRNPKVVIPVNRSQTCTCGTSDAMVVILGEASGGVLGRGRLLWTVAEVEKTEEKMSAAVQHDKIEKQARLRDEYQVDDFEAMFNEPVVPGSDEIGTLDKRMSTVRAQAIDDMSYYFHELRAEFQYREGSDDKLHFWGGLCFKCEVSAPAKDKEDFVSRGHEGTNWKPKPHWCDANGNILDVYKSGSDAVEEYWIWEERFFASEEATKIVKAIRNRVPRLMYGTTISVQMLDYYLERSEERQKAFVLEKGDNILQYKYVKIGCLATMDYLLGVNRMAQVANALILGEISPTIDNALVTGTRANTFSDEEVQKYILMKMPRNFLTPELRIKLQNKKFKDRSTVGKKIVQQVLKLQDTGVLVAHDQRIKQEKSNSNSNSNSNDKSKKKRGGLKHPVYAVEKKTSDEWMGDRNDAILALFGTLGIMKSKYDEINVKVQDPVEVKSENDDDDGEVDGDLSQGREKDKEKEKSVEIVMDIDASEAKCSGNAMPSLESGSADESPASLNNSPKPRRRDKRQRAIMLSGSPKYGPYGPVHHQGDSPPKPARSRLRSRGLGTSATYKSKRNKASKGRGGRRGRRRGQRESIIRGMGDNDNTNENENVGAANEDAAPDDLLAQGLFNDPNLNKIGAASVGAGLDPALREQLDEISANFDQYQNKEFDVSSRTRSHKQLGKKHLEGVARLLQSEESDDISSDNSSDNASDSARDNDNENANENDNDNDNANNDDNDNDNENANENDNDNDNANNDNNENDNGNGGENDNDNGNDNGDGDNDDARAASKQRLHPMRLRKRNVDKEEEKGGSKTAKRAAALSDMINIAKAAGKGKRGSKKRGVKKAKATRGRGRNKAPK